LSRAKDLLLLTLLLALALPAAAEDSLAILPFRSTHENRFAKRKLEMWTRQHLPQFYQRDVQGGEKSFEHDTAARALLDCDFGEVSCLKTVADIAGVKELVVGTLNDAGNRLTLRWINYKPKTPIQRRMAMRLNPDASQREPDVRHLAACLFGNRCGEITLIKLGKPGVDYRVWVNGVLMRGPTLRVPEGAHVLRIEKKGFAVKDLRKTVHVGDKTSVEPVLVPLDPRDVQQVVDKPKAKPAESLWMPGEG
jgi:hypothetical protein